MSSYDYIVQHSRSHVKCNLCNVFLTSNDQNIETHVEGRTHSAHYYLTRLKIQNNIVVYECEDHDKLRCVICDEYFSYSDDIDSVTEHIESYEHEHAMGEIDQAISGQYLNLPVVGSRPVHCTICDCKVGFTLNCITEHTEGFRHRRALADQLRKDNGIFKYANNDDDLWCKICNVVIDNDLDSILDHVNNDADHESILEELENVVEDEDISLEKFLSELNEDKAYCKTCEVYVPCNVHNLTEHIEGCRHSRLREEE
ncbi:unnamed protein product [Plutella xylostella]|uniref:(diamondback moth) hypothetical protein n=1 Tax=Plutella xylostella TaxID=51655 RepID=A0A8S4G6B3_PLUXY|nr:unnamed protein product [Plutella xylostella]